MAMKLSPNEIRDITSLLEQGKPLPEKYRFALFGEHRNVELVWDGKTNAVTDVQLPFQVIEQVDEPRSEKAMNQQFDLFDAATGRQLKGWSNKLIWGDKASKHSIAQYVFSDICVVIFCGNINTFVKTALLKGKKRIGPLNANNSNGPKCSLATGAMTDQQED
jgi:hypothetical protein